MKIIFHALSALFVVAAYTCPATSIARTWYITPDGTGDAPTIQAGIDSASSGDIVEVACGQYGEYNLELKSGITLQSETGQVGCVSLDLNGNGRGFYCFEVDSVTIEGFTVQNGFWTYGAGLYSMSSALTVRNCEFSDGYSIGDGAISAIHSSIEIIDCDFFGNASFNEGPGAIYCRDTNAKISGCNFVDNVADGSGGGMWIIDGGVSLTDCLFIENHAMGLSDYALGGALLVVGLEHSSHQISNCTFYGNAGNEAIYVDEGEKLNFENTIIAFNQGLSISVYNEVAPEIACCDIYGNTDGDWVDFIQDLLGVQGNISEDPQFCDCASGNVTLMSSSPCAEENNLECGQIGALPVGCIVDAVGEGTTPSGSVALIRNYPNPFNPHTTFSFSVDDNQHIGIFVYDLAGKRVSTLANQMYGVGFHLVHWDGKDSTGHPLSSGTYLVRLETESVVQSRKVMLVR